MKNLKNSLYTDMQIKLFYLSVKCQGQCHFASGCVNTEVVTVGAICHPVTISIGRTQHPNLGT